MVTIKWVWVIHEGHCGGGVLSRCHHAGWIMVVSKEVVGSLSVLWSTWVFQGNLINYFPHASSCAAMHFPHASSCAAMHHHDSSPIIVRLGAAFKLLGIRMKQWEIAEIVAEVDRDGSGEWQLEGGAVDGNDGYQ